MMTLIRWSQIQLVSLSILVLIGFSSIGQSRKATFSTDSAALISIAQQLFDAIAPGDTLPWKKYLHPEFVARLEDGTRKRKSEMIKEIRPLPKNYVGKIWVVNPVVVQYNDTFILNYIADEILHLYGQTIHTGYAETDTYVKTTTGFQLLAMELFELPTDPAIVNVQPETLRTYTGVYQLTDGVEFIVTLENGSLMGTRTGRPPVELKPETETMFFVSDQRGRKIFAKDSTGRVIKMIDRRSGHDLVWFRK